MASTSRGLSGILIHSLLLILLVTNTTGTVSNFSVAVILSEYQWDLEEAYRLAVKPFEADSHIHVSLTKTSGSVDSDTRAVNTAVFRSPSVIIGPITPAPYAVRASSVAATLGIPHIPISTMASADDQDQHSQTWRAKIVAKLMVLYKWKKLALIADPLITSAQDLQELVTMEQDRQFQITETHYISTSDDNAQYKKILESVKKTGSRVILLLSSPETAKKLMKQAANLQMTTPGWAWVMDESVVSYEGMYGPCLPPGEHLWGVVAFRKKFELDEGKKDDFAKRWSQYETKKCGCKSAFKERENLIQPILTYDMIGATLRSLRQMADDEEYPGTTAEAPNITSRAVSELQSDNGTVVTDQCPPAHSQFNAHKFNRILKKELEQGIVKQWAPKMYEIVNLQDFGWETLGECEADSAIPLDISLSATTFHGRTNRIPKDTGTVEGLVLEIVTILDPPFVMWDNSSEHASTSPQLQGLTGLCMDLLMELQTVLAFNFTIHLVEDGNYGSFNEGTAKWNGMIGELMDKKADMALASLSIDYERQTVVDFTKPYIEAGTTILMSRGGGRDKSLLAFIEPFSYDLWYAVVGTILVGALAIHLFSRLSPFGYHTMKEKEKLTLANSLWFVWASQMDQGVEIMPRCLSARIVSGVFWFVAFIISASYTANLTAFLTVNRLTSVIESIEDLAGQSTIDYGTVINSQTASFFESQDLAPYKRMASMMQSRKSNVLNTAEGVRKVRQSKNIPLNKPGAYAFMFDNHLLDFIAKNEPCDTMTTGRLFNKGGYGIAFRLGLEMKEAFSLEILKLRQNGVIEKLTKKWISGPCPQGDDAQRAEDQGQLTFNTLRGIFYLFGLGVGLGLIAILLEYTVSSVTRRAHDTKSCFYSCCQPLRNFLSKDDKKMAAAVAAASEANAATSSASGYRLAHHAGLGSLQRCSEEDLYNGAATTNSNSLSFSRDRLGHTSNAFI